MTVALRFAAVAALVVHLVGLVAVMGQPLAVPHDEAALGALSLDAGHREGPAADFFAVFHAGVAAEQGTDPYAREEAPEVTPYFYDFRYLPTLGPTLGRALTALPPRTAWHVWVGVLEAMLLLTLGILWRHLAPRRALSAAALLLGSTPFLLELHMGQFTFAAVALATLGLVARDRDGPTGLLGTAAGWGGAMALKVFPLAAIPALLHRRRDALRALVAIALLVLFAIPGFVWVPDGLATFWSRNFATPVGGYDGGNVSLAYTLGVAGLGGAAFALAIALRPFVLLAVAVVVLTSRLRDAWLGAALLLLAHFVTYVHVWEHHVSGILLVGCWILVGLDSDEDVPWHVAAALVLLALPTPFVLLAGAADPASWDPTETWSLPAKVALAGCKSLPTTWLFLWTLRRHTAAGFTRPALWPSPPAPPSA